MHAALVEVSNQHALVNPLEVKALFLAPVHEVVKHLSVGCHVVVNDSSILREVWGGVRALGSVFLSLRLCVVGVKFVACACFHHHLRFTYHGQVARLGQHAGVDVLDKQDIRVGP